MVLPNVPETVSRRGELDSNTFHDDLSLKRQRFCYIQRTQQAILLLHSFSFQNGFKCHTMSESHQRQLLLLAEDVDKYMDSFSR